MHTALCHGARDGGEFALRDCRLSQHGFARGQGSGLVEHGIGHAFEAFKS